MRTDAQTRSSIKGIRWLFQRIWFRSFRSNRVDYSSCERAPPSSVGSSPMSTAVDPTVPPSGTGCVECDAVGGWWVHLRRCAACGHIGCCDDSLARPASAHWRETGHPIIRSFEPAEDWFWNYDTNEYYDGPQLAAPECHPEDQAVPGPADRVPPDWVKQLRSRD